MRKLASVQKVLKVEPIENADNIEKITINGWTVVSQKGNFLPGDLGVFYEVDSIPPDIPFYQFLWNRNHEDTRPDKYRLKTMRLRGVLSQGLMLPLQEVLNAHGIMYARCHEGDDLTEALGVEKYEKPVPISANMDGDWVWSYVPKTDELRLQSFPKVLDELKGLPYIITEKCDGTSMSFGFDDEDKFRVCSRNNSITPGDNAYWKLFNDNPYLIEKLRTYFSDLVFQGELCGPSIQGNKLNLKAPTWFGFSIWSNSDKCYLPYNTATAVFKFFDELKTVREVDFGPSFDYTLDLLLEFAKGKYEGTTNHREGIVIRPCKEELHSDVLGTRLSFKVLNNDFLLKEKD